MRDQQHSRITSWALETPRQRGRAHAPIRGWEGTSPSATASRALLQHGTQRKRVQPHTTREQESEERCSARMWAMVTAGPTGFPLTSNPKPPPTNTTSCARAQGPTSSRYVSSSTPGCRQSSSVVASGPMLSRTITMERDMSFVSTAGCAPPWHWPTLSHNLEPASTKNSCCCQIQFADHDFHRRAGATIKAHPCGLRSRLRTRRLRNAPARKRHTMVAMSAKVHGDIGRVRERGWERELKVGGAETPANK